MEERILQNLAIVASIERRHRLAQMEGMGIQQIDHDRSQFSLFSNQHAARDNPNAIHMSSQSTPVTSNEDEPSQQTQQLQNESSSTSDTLRSRFNALSTRYVFLFITCVFELCILSNNFV